MEVKTYGRYKLKGVTRFWQNEIISFKPYGIELLNWKKFATNLTPRE